MPRYGSVILDRLLRGIASDIDVPPGHEPYEEPAEDDGYYQHAEPDGRGIAQIEETEGRLIETDRDDLGGVGRPARRGDPDDVVIADSVHRADQQCHQDDGADHRQHDKPETLPRRRTVDAGRLQGLARQGTQAGRNDQD